MEGKNLQDAFSNSELPERQKAREAMGAAAPGIKAGTAPRTERNDEFHHGDWKAALHEYLKTAYKGSKSMGDITSGGTVYQFMEKDDKVTFYDADGNTLFHAGYEQLETEYVQLKGQQEADGVNCQIRKQIEESGEEGLQCSGGIGEKCTKCEKAGEAESEDTAKKETVKNNMPESSSGAKESSGSAKDLAKKKLVKELKKAKDKSFAEPVIEYLIKRCGEDEGLSRDVMQEHKTWEKCYGYLYSMAQKSAQGSRCCAVRDDVVCEWAEDYYRKDDKAEEEKKAGKAAEAKKKAEERKAKAKEAAGAKENHGTKAPDKKAAVSDGQKKERVKPKKNIRDMEGQMDMFSMMGI